VTPFACQPPTFFSLQAPFGRVGRALFDPYAAPKNFRPSVTKKQDPPIADYSPIQKSFSGIQHAPAHRPFDHAKAGFCGELLFSAMIPNNSKELSAEKL